MGNNVVFKNLQSRLNDVKRKDLGFDMLMFEMKKNHGRVDDEQIEKHRTEINTKYDIGSDIYNTLSQVAEQAFEGGDFNIMYKRLRVNTQ